MFTQTDDTIVWQHIYNARIAFLSYLYTLSEDQWNHDSLCKGWRVRDVVGHLVLVFNYDAKTFYKPFIKSGFRINVFMKQTAITLGNKPIQKLIDAFEVTINEQHKPAALSTLNVLSDLLLHEQDIRVPLGQPSAMPLDSLRLIFRHWEPTEFNLGEKITGIAKRVKGLKFVAIDLNITKGDGLRVEGTAQDILQVMVGRSISLHKLSGNGVETLARRII